VTYAIVVDREHIWTAELEHQHHLDGPSTDTTHSDKTLDDRFVIQFE